MDLIGVLIHVALVLLLLLVLLLVHLHGAQGPNQVLGQDVLELLLDHGLLLLQGFMNKRQCT